MDESIAESTTGRQNKDSHCTESGNFLFSKYKFESSNSFSLQILCVFPMNFRVTYPKPFADILPVIGWESFTEYHHRISSINVLWADHFFSFPRWVKIFSFDTSSLDCLQEFDVVSKLFLQTCLPIALSFALYVGYRLQSLMIHRKHDLGLKSIDTREDPTVEIRNQRAEVATKLAKLHYLYRKQKYKLKVGKYPILTPLLTC